MTTKEKTFHIKEEIDQKIILISALRYALGRKTYTPSMICKIIKDNIGDVYPCVADIMARDIRDFLSKECCLGVGFSVFYDCDIKPFIDLLPILDEAAKPIYRGQYSYPQPPIGYDSWHDVPEYFRYTGVKHEEKGLC